MTYGKKKAKVFICLNLTYETKRIFMSYIDTHKITGVNKSVYLIGTTLLDTLQMNDNQRLSLPIYYQLQYSTSFFTYTNVAWRYIVIWQSGTKLPIRIVHKQTAKIKKKLFFCEETKVVPPFIGRITGSSLDPLFQVLVPGCNTQQDLN